MKWCKDAHNFLAMDKLKCRRKEVLAGDAPDVTMFKCHTWWKIYYYDPKVKKPKYPMKPGQFLDTDCQNGDSSCHFIQAKPEDGKRSQTLVRSIIRSTKEIELS